MRDGVDTLLSWPCYTQRDRTYGMVARWCRGWGCSGTWLKAATGGGWSQFTFVSALVSAFVSPRSFIWWDPDSCGYGICRWGIWGVIDLEKEMATHSSVLAWRIPGTAEPGGLPSMGSHRVRHNWSDLAAADLWGWSFLNEMTAFICKRHTEPPSPPRKWRYNEKCVTRKDPADHAEEIYFHCL